MRYDIGEVVEQDQQSIVEMLRAEGGKRLKQALFSQHAKGHVATTKSLFRGRSGYTITQTLRRDGVIGKGPSRPTAVTEICVNRPQYGVVCRLRALERKNMMSLDEREK